MSEEPEYIGIDEFFSFTCSDKVNCFNMCCRDVNQFLYPYDIIRLKNGLDMSSTDFLEKYTITYPGDTTGLPVVSFKTTPADGHTCPFVSEQGCRVYNDRPASCRMFPLARAISRNRETGCISEHYALIKDPVCEGFQNGLELSPREWITNQGLEIYNKYNDLMIELISLKHQIMPGSLEGVLKDKFIMACYDVDRFKATIINENLIPKDEISDDLLAQCAYDDTALLNVGLSWIRKELFGNR